MGDGGAKLTLMARASIPLIQALRETALRLERSDVTYRWSHFAHCNCGHLVQTITGLAPAEVQLRAVGQEGDWGEQARSRAPLLEHPRPDYGDRPALDEGAWEPENVGRCSTTGTPLDVVFDQLGNIGLEASDVQHLERLSDPDVRRRLGKNTLDFLHYERRNVVDYLRAWADLLSEKLEPSAHDIAIAAE